MNTKHGATIELPVRVAGIVQTGRCLKDSMTWHRDFRALCPNGIQQKTATLTRQTLFTARTARPGGFVQKVMSGTPDVRIEQTALAARRVPSRALTPTSQQSFISSEARNSGPEKLALRMRGQTGFRLSLGMAGSRFT